MYGTVGYALEDPTFKHSFLTDVDFRVIQRCQKAKTSIGKTEDCFIKKASDEQ